MSREQETVFACVMDAIPKDEREQHGGVSAQLLGSVQEIRARDNGYTFRLPTDSNTIVNLAEFIRNERLCCPFFNFTVEVEGNGGPIWLHLTGTQGIQEFIIAEIGGYLNPTALAAAGIS